MRAALLAVLAGLAACAYPAPCTRALCVARVDGTMRVEGWQGSVTETSESAKAPIVSDAKVTMVYGSAAFVHEKTLVRAQEGSSFVFTVSTRAVSAIEVSSGVVTVAPFHGAEATLVPGVPYALPKP